MATLIEIEGVRTYATKANAIKAVERKIAPQQLTELRYFIQKTESDRYIPVFIGAECLQHGIHFHFNVIG